MRLRTAAALLALALPGALVASAQPQASGAADDPVAALLAAGEDAYARNCSVCHGPTGGGIEEARLRFPPEERRCTRCHRPSNPVVQPLDRPFVDNDMFSIGDPPPLHPTPERPTALASVVAPQALQDYLSRTMPRYDPGRLSDAEYRALTALLLAMNGRGDELAALAGATDR